MEKYDHKKIEKKWQEYWEKNKTYEARENSEKKKFYGLIEFPYPSGEGLHVGHIRPTTAMDIIARKRRAEGYEVLYPIGYDAFGLPTENYAIKTGVHPTVVTEQNTDNFRRQLKSLGFSFDWSREINTTDPEYYKWTQFIFQKFFEKGLAYKKKMAINWCPKDKIGLANEEVVDGKCERCGTPVEKREKEQWMLAITKYADRLDKDLDTVDYLEKIKIQQRNWIGKSEGAEIEFQIKSGEAQKPEKKVLIGTRNPAKVQMIKSCLADVSGINFISLNDLPPIDDSDLIEGDDFLENARKKSEYYYKKTGIPTISTDHILWIEKWSENKGFINHIRKLANPNSSKASDGEVLSFLKDFLKKVGGQSNAHFHYAISYTDGAGTLCVDEIPHEYTLQEKQSETFWPGYPTEALLIDKETGVFKSEQSDDVRYIKVANLLKKVFVPRMVGSEGIKIKVFTTRPDTIFGATYLVLAPEHSFISEQIQNTKSEITNKSEIQDYINQSKNKTDIERTALEKDKTGVELKGIKAINPASGEEIPVWIADYVLAEYGTGAIMAVPAHDERDFQFARKYNLPIRQVIAPDVSNKDNPPRQGKKNTEREVVHIILRDVKKKEVLLGFLKDASWGERKPINFVIGGIEEGETPEEAGRREVLEETGYKDIKFIEEMPRVEAQFFQAQKDVNRRVYVRTLVFDLLSQFKDKVSEEELSKHEFKWIAEEKIGELINIPDDVFTWRYYYIGGFAYAGNGYLLNSGEFNGKKSEEIKKEITEFAGGKWVTKFKLRDWVFSRQRYWGEPIPLIFCEHCKKSAEIIISLSSDRDELRRDKQFLTSQQEDTKKQFSEGEILNPGWIAVPEEDLPVKLPDVKNYKPTDTGESPLSAISDWVNTKCPRCGGPAKRETDTMPNWAGSSWYYLRYADPKNNKEFASREKLDYWLPVDWYNGGMEHTTLHLLYSRFWHKFLFDLGMVKTSEPYQKRTSHGLILAEGGEKMSKSKGNVVNPNELIDIYGADSVRIYEMFTGPFDQAVAWNSDSIIGVRRFLEKVWRTASKVSEIKKTGEENNKVIYTTLNKTIKKVGEDIEAMRFNTAVSALMICANEMDSAENVPKDLFEKYIRILEPFAPHVVNEIWEQMGNSKSIDTSQWPIFDEGALEEEFKTIAVQVNGKIKSTIQIQKGISESELEKTALNDDKIKQAILGKEIKKIIVIKGKIVSIVAS